MAERTRCFSPGLGYLIIVWVIIATISLVLSYSIALSNGHISPYVPAISDTTSRNPEGAIFAEFFNITAFLSLVIMSVRYVQVRMLNRLVEGGESSKLFQLNSLSYVFGVMSSLGATIVANFRPSKSLDSMEVVHVIGSVMLFISGAAYCWTQTAITHQLTKFNLDTKPTFTARLIITLLQTIATLAFLVSWGIAYAMFGKNSLPGTTSLTTPEDEGFPIYTTGNITEWLAAWCLGLFGVSFFKEFQKISLNVQCIPKCGGLRSDALKYATIPDTALIDESSESD